MKALDAALHRWAAIHRIDGLVGTACRMAMACGGLSRVSSLAQATGLSPRQFERRFASHVGLAPKSFLRVVRFQQVLKAIDAGGAPTGRGSPSIMGFTISRTS